MSTQYLVSYLQNTKKIFDCLLYLDSSEICSVVHVLKVLFMNWPVKGDKYFSLQLALKHRQGKNHRMRIVVFVGSPVEDDEKEVNIVV